MHILILFADICKIFLGAFFGAACAFEYERRSKRDEKMKKQMVALRMLNSHSPHALIAFWFIHKQFLVLKSKIQTVDLIATIPECNEASDNSNG
jgi:hypothetical protein